MSRGCKFDQSFCGFPSLSSSLSLLCIYRENCKYGHDALLPEIRKMSRLCFPLRKSLKIDKVTLESKAYGLISFHFSDFLTDSK